MRRGAAKPSSGAFCRVFQRRADLGRSQICGSRPRRVRNIPDTSARLDGLLAGELDIIANISPAQIATINASSNAEVLSVAGSTHFYFGFNHDKAPSSDLHFRQAINHALDRKLVIERVMDGNALPLAAPMSVNDTGYNTELQVAEFDLEKSKALLAEIFIAPGTEFVVDCIAANKEHCEILCALLSRTGLTFRPQIWEGAVLSPAWPDLATRADRQPGDPVELILGTENVSSEEIANQRREHGLDDPIWLRCFYVGNALNGNFGTSFCHSRAVSRLILERMPPLSS